MKPGLLWRLAPRVLFRFPRSAAAVAFSAAIVVLATILGPLFLSSSESASLRAGMDQSGRWEAGLQIVWRDFEYPDTAEEEATYLELARAGLSALSERAEAEPSLGAPTMTLLGGEGTAATEADTALVRLVHRTDAYENVTIVEGQPGDDGVWIADVTARALEIGPGDSFELTTPTGRTTARVAGVYGFLRDERREFWSPLTDFIYKAPEADVPPPPFVLADPDFVVAQDASAQIRWNVPVAAGDLPPETLRDAARAFNALTREVLTDTGVGETLSSIDDLALEPGANTLLPGIIRTADERLEASQAPTGVVTAAARLLGAGLMIAAGISLVARRRSEVRALIARGAGPASLAARFAVEGGGPVALGTIVAVGAGYTGVRLFGAAGGVQWSYVAGLAGQVALAAAGALLLLALSTGAAVTREERSFRARSTAGTRLVPVVAGAAVAAGGMFAYRALESISVAESDEALSGSILLAPIGVIAAASLGAGVVLRLLLPTVASWARRRSTGIFLASRRLAAGSGMTHTLVIVCGTALGVMLFGLTVAGSVHRTAVAKAKTFVGSDFAVGIGPNPPELPDLGFPLTNVLTLETYLEDSNRPVTVIGIVPETFEGAAFWDDELADEPLADLVDKLHDAPRGPIPVVAAGFADDSPVAITGSSASLEIVATARAFPGMTQGQPLLAMSIDSARRVLASGGSGSRIDQIWAKGDPEVIQTALLEAGQAAYEPLTAEEVLDTPTIQSLVWSLGLLGGVGALASATAVAGLSLYLQARHTAAQVSAAMTRRMGLPRRAELISWVAEIAGAGLASFAVGLAAGLVTASLVHERLDTQPDLEPSPILVVPRTAVIVGGLAVAVVAGVTARRLQTRMDRTSVGEIMRV